MISFGRLQTEQVRGRNAGRATDLLGHRDGQVALAGKNQVKVGIRTADLTRGLRLPVFLDVF